MAAAHRRRDRVGRLAVLLSSVVIPGRCLFSVRVSRSTRVRKKQFARNDYSRPPPPPSPRRVALAEKRVSNSRTCPDGYVLDARKTSVVSRLCCCSCCRFADEIVEGKKTYFFFQRRLLSTDKKRSGLSRRNGARDTRSVLVSVPSTRAVRPRPACAIVQNNNNVYDN